MANVNPNSTIMLLHNCPLDKTYDHTIYFTNLTDQTNYFSSLSKYTFTNYSYVRQDRRLKVQASVGQNLYDCNYMMFKNTSFENKWFYAFVTHVEYDNNLTWLIDFELDVMQSWFFDYELERCFVAREHSRTDEIGDNLVPESLELGDYVSEGITRTADNNIDTGSMTDSALADLSLVFACTFDRQYNDYYGGYYNGMYSGLCFIDFPFPKPATTANIQSFVNNVRTWLDGATGAGKPQGIVTAFVMPTAFVRSDTTPSTNVGFTKTATFNDIDGHPVRNKKLFTFPYNFLYATNMQGQSCAYHFEYFSDPEELGFQLETNYAPNTSVVLTPLNYKGTGLANYDEKLVLSGYPELPYATDVFKAWCAMSSGQEQINAIASISSSAISGGMIGAIAGGQVIPGAIVGAGVGIATTVASYLQNRHYQDIKPPQANTGAGSTTMASIGMLDFAFMHKHVRKEFAEIIDDYFDMYGYATHRCKIPNRNVRPHWTYTKTVGCCVKGSVPADDMATICKIYDTGITFWRYGAEVGRYDLDNRPVSN